MDPELSALSAALMHRHCRVERREADWNFNFGDGANLAASVPWRIVTAEGIAHGSEDDGQQFGLREPVDGESRANELLRGRTVVGVEVTPLPADLHITLDGGTRLDLFNNSSGYEGWLAYLAAGSRMLTIVGMGGGRLFSRRG